MRPEATNDEPDEITYLEALRSALADAMRDDERASTGLWKV
jgi:hypothetical protein